MPTVVTAAEPTHTHTHDHTLNFLQFVSGVAEVEHWFNPANLATLRVSQRGDFQPQFVARKRRLKAGLRPLPDRVHGSNW